MLKVEQILGFGAERDAGPSRVICVHVDLEERSVDPRGAPGYTASEGVIGELVALARARKHATIGVVVTKIGGRRGTGSYTLIGGVISEVIGWAPGLARHAERVGVQHRS